MIAAEDEIAAASDHQAALERSLRDVPLDVVAAAISNSGDMAMLASWTGVPPLYIYRGRGLWACSDDLERIVAAIEELRERGASVVIVSHLGRPEGKPNPKLSLAPIRTSLNVIGDGGTPPVLGATTPVEERAIDAAVDALMNTPV